MSTLYKLGCKWGEGNNPLFYNFIKDNNLLIGVHDVPYDINDYVLVTEGFTAKAIAKVKSEPISIEEYEEFYDDFERYGIPIEEWVQVYKGEFSILEEEFKYKHRKGISEVAKPEIREKVFKIIKEEELNKNMKENIKVLKHKKQIILQGAPGTGKTYISAEIAMNLIHNDKKYNSRKQIMVDYQKAIEDGRIAFTTFHQSMDYEEFVEGLKPELTETGGVTYAVQPGIFKEMCNKAQEKGSLDKLEEAIENLKEKALEETINLETKTELAFTLSYRGGTTFRVRPQSSKTDENNDFPANISYIKELFKNEKAKMYNKSYVWGILDYLKKNFDLGTYTESSEALPYILIIDEINRGNISKVLGELITLLESDKRIGEENEIRVKLPYSSEDEPFGVPSNLYIIGTMNTADRSVGHIDYAIRRRFSFITLQSQLSAIENYYTKLGDNNAPNEIAIELFEEIEELMENIAPDFDKHDLMIGHSYFMAKTEEDLELKLKYEIKPLLREYVKDGILLLQPDENGDYQEIEGIEL